MTLPASTKLGPPWPSVTHPQRQARDAMRAQWLMLKSTQEATHDPQVPSRYRPGCSSHAKHALLIESNPSIEVARECSATNEAAQHVAVALPSSVDLYCFPIAVRASKGPEHQASTQMETRPKQKKRRTRDQALAIKRSAIHMRRHRRRALPRGAHPVAQMSKWDQLLLQH